MILYALNYKILFNKIRNLKYVIILEWKQIKIIVGMVCLVMLLKEYLKRKFNINLIIMLMWRKINCHG
jgi:hypothetical protein